MKVFMCTRQGGYSGGLAVVAANSVEEAFKTFYKKVANLVDWKDYDYKSVTYRANKKEFIIEEL